MNLTILKIKIKQSINVYNFKLSIRKYLHNFKNEIVCSRKKLFTICDNTNNNSNNNNNSNKQLSNNNSYSSAFEVVRNSIESMCLSYSAFDCILLESINSLLLVHGPLARKMSQDRNVSLRTFQSIFFSLCRCCCLLVCLF